jgi:hypothetical protein
MPAELARACTQVRKVSQANLSYGRTSRAPITPPLAQVLSQAGLLGGELGEINTDDARVGC